MRGTEQLFQISSTVTFISYSGVSSGRRRKKARPVHCLWGFFQPKDSQPPKKDHHYHDGKLPPMLPGLVRDTFLAGKELRCCYKASLDGFSAFDFHKCCDFQGPSVVLGLTEERLQFGGFNPFGFRSTNDYYDSLKAFLFYCPDELNAEAPVILPKIGGPGAAIFDYVRGGPQFGADGLVIGPPQSPVMGGFAGPDPNGTGQGDLRHAESRLGFYYARRPDGKDSIFGDEKEATLVEVEVYACPAIAETY